MKCFVAFLMTLAVVNSFPLKNDEDSSLKRKILRPTAHRRVLIAPRPNDPNVYGDWPWTNGGNTIGGSHNNGNSGWGYPHNNGYYGKRDTAPRPNDPNVYGDWPWTNGGNTIGGSHNNGNSGWGYPHNNGYYGKREIIPAMNDFGERKGQGSNDMEKYE